MALYLHLIGATVSFREKVSMQIFLGLTPEIRKKKTTGDYTLSDSQDKNTFYQSYFT